MKPLIERANEITKKEVEATRIEKKNQYSKTTKHKTRNLLFIRRPSL